MLRLIHIAFGLHILVEAPAALNFIVNPSEELQLGTPSPSAEALIRQYALLIICSNLIALVFLMRPIDTVSHRIAYSLGIYHLGLALRAISRLVRNEPALRTSLGRPAVHLVVHMFCFTVFITGIIPWPVRKRKR